MLRPVVAQPQPPRAHATGRAATGPVCRKDRVRVVEREPPERWNGAEPFSKMIGTAPQDLVVRIQDEEPRAIEKRRHGQLHLRQRIQVADTVFPEVIRRNVGHHGHPRP